MTFNYDAIQPLDIVCCTSLSTISTGIRIKEAGVLNAFNTSISTHVGIVVPVGYSGPRMLGIAEMLKTLEINPFSNYKNNGFFGSRLVDIVRFEPFSDPIVQARAIQQIYDWWEARKKYDFTGMLKYVMPFLKDANGRFYCSEMISWISINIANAPICANKKGDDCTPYDIQKSKLITQVKYLK